MCLPCGSSLNLTDAASKHSPRVVLRCCPDGLLLSGEGLRRWGPGTVCPRGGNHLLRVAGESSFLHCFACLVGMGELENVFLSFFLKTIHFNLSHSWKNHNPPSSLPGLRFWKTHLPCHLLLPWVYLEQQLISCKWVWGWDFHECVRTPDSCGLTPLKYTLLTSKGFHSFSPSPKSHMKLISQGTDQGTLTYCLNWFKALSIFSWPVTLDVRRWAELQRTAIQMSSFPHEQLTSSHSFALGVREFMWVSISPGPPLSLVLHLDAWVQGCSSCSLLVLTLQRFDKVSLFFLF